MRCRLVTHSHFDLHTGRIAGRARGETVLRVSWAMQIKFLMDASTSGGSEAIAAAVISQTFMNLGDSDVMVKKRDKPTRKAQDDAFGDHY